MGIRGGGGVAEERGGFGEIREKKRERKIRVRPFFTYECELRRRGVLFFVNYGDRVWFWIFWVGWYMERGVCRD